MATFTLQFEKALKDYDFSKEEIKALFLQDQQEVEAEYNQIVKIEEEKKSAELLKNTRQKDLEKHEKTNPFEFRFLFLKVVRPNLSLFLNHLLLI